MCERSMGGPAHYPFASQQQQQDVEPSDLRRYRMNTTQHPLMHDVVMQTRESILVKTYMKSIDWLCDHCVKGVEVFPATGSIELMLAAARLMRPSQAWIRDCEICRMVFPIATTSSSPRDGVARQTVATNACTWSVS